MKNNLMQERGGRGKSMTKPIICPKCKRAGKPFIKTELVEAHFQLVMDENGEHKIYRPRPDLSKQVPGSSYRPRSVKVYTPRGVDIIAHVVCRYCQEVINSESADIIFFDECS